MNESMSLSAFFDNVTIKSTLFGGFDKESTYDFLQQLTELVQRRMAVVCGEKEDLLRELDIANQKLEQMQRLLDERNESSSEGETQEQRSACATGVNEEIETRVLNFEQRLEKLMQSVGCN